MKIRGQGAGARAGEEGRTGAPPRPAPNVTEYGDPGRLSCLAAAAFFLGVGAAAGAVGVGVVFAWPWLAAAARWLGWLVGTHPGPVMLALVAVSFAALRAARWLDEREP